MALEERQPVGDPREPAQARPPDAHESAEWLLQDVEWFSPRRRTTVKGQPEALQRPSRLWGGRRRRGRRAHREDRGVMNNNQKGEMAVGDDTSGAWEAEQHEAREEQFRAERAKVGSGWHPIIDDLHDNLGMLLGDYDVLQIKEQYGGLRYYILLDFRVEPENRMQALHAIGDAERKSLLTCEGCAENGDTQYHGGWYKTLCNKHHKEVEDVMSQAARVAVANWLGVKHTSSPA